MQMPAIMCNCDTANTIAIRAVCTNNETILVSLKDNLNIRASYMSYKEFKIAGTSK